MLIQGRSFWKLHGRWLVAALALAAGAIAWTVLAGSRQGRWPGGGTLSGLALGIAAAAIFLFECALVIKKTPLLRAARWSLPAQVWMKAHIWLGLLTVPLVLLHSGGRLGGVLTMLLVAVFGVVIASGLWGLALQNLLPRMLLEAAPAETIYSQIDSVGRQYAAEARRLVANHCGANGNLDSDAVELAESGAAAIHGAPRQVGTQLRRAPQPVAEMHAAIDSPAIRAALDESIAPFLAQGVCPRGQLGSRQRNEWFFEDLELRAPPELRQVVGQLAALCERRRQLNLQRRLHFWLHNWLWLHLPLSLALLVLLAGHIVFALRFG